MEPGRRNGLPRPSPAVTSGPRDGASARGTVCAVGIVDDYLAGLGPDDRAAFERIRAVALGEVPDAGQATSYGLAALTHRGKPLVGFRVSGGHLAVYPFSPAAVDAGRPLLDGFALSKGTIRFSAAQPLPEDAVRAVVRARVAEIDG